MKKSLIAMASLCAFAGAAQAQTSVTLYGILDQGFGWTNNVAGADSNVGGKSQFQAAGGTLSGSRWGLRGAEDLGGGLKAIFVLESGFSVGTGYSGQDNRLFGRQAFVGLTSDKFGSVTLGRQYDAVVDNVASFAMGSQWAGGIGAHPYDLDNLNNSSRANNALKYTSPNINGFQFSGTVSPGGKVGSLGGNLVWSAGASYANGPLSLGAGYLSSKDPAFAPLALRNFILNVNNVKPETFVSNSSNYQVAAAGGAYTFGAATIGMTYSNTRYKTLGTITGAVPGGIDLRAHNAEVNFKYQFTPALMAGIGYQYTQGKDSDGKFRSHQISLGTDYALSKRTDIYLVGSIQRTDKDHRAALNGNDPSSNRQQIGVLTGIRHKF